MKVFFFPYRIKTLQASASPLRRCPRVRAAPVKMHVLDMMKNRSREGCLVFNKSESHLHGDGGSERCLVYIRSSSSSLHAREVGLPSPIRFLTSSSLGATASSMSAGSGSACKNACAGYGEKQEREIDVWSTLGLRDYLHGL